MNSKPGPYVVTVEWMRVMRLLYVLVFDAVGSRAPWRERHWAKVTVHVSGIEGLISEGTAKKGLYCPHECVMLARQV